jgi:hypothetical protein
LPLPDLILTLLNFRKGTVNSELRQFAKAVHGQDALRPVTASAFCQARRKFRHEALIELNHRALKAFEDHVALRRWQGFRLLVVDGSTGRLPNEEEIAKAFGGPVDANCPMARFSRLYDVLNKLVVYADMAPYATGERELAANYLYQTREDDLTLYDRGYGAFWLFSMHRDMERPFCARLPLSFSKEVKDFLASGKPSDEVLFRPSGPAKRQCEEYNLSAEPVLLRLIRVELENGSVEVLATSLLDRKAYPTRGFAKLYALRWGVEENYKREKVRLEIENFSGCTVWTVYQDFHAKIVALNLAAMLEWVAQAIADRVYAKREHPYQINFANALSVLKNDLIRWLSKGMPWDMLLRLLTEIVDAVEPVIPGRSFPRNLRKSKAREFHANYKRTA